MKQIFFYFFILLSVTEAKAQHSDLYNYIMNTVKPTHFPARNTVTITTNSRDGFSRDNQPVLVINDVVQKLDEAHNITMFTALDAYTMADLQRIVVWNTPRDVLRIYGYPKGALGVLFVYTADYVFPNPAQPTTRRTGMGADTNPNKIIVLENPVPNTIPTPNNGGNKGKKGK